MESDRDETDLEKPLFVQVKEEPTVSDSTFEEEDFNSDDSTEEYFTKRSRLSERVSNSNMSNFESSVYLDNDTQYSISKGSVRHSREQALRKNFSKNLIDHKSICTGEFKRTTVYGPISEDVTESNNDKESGSESTENVLGRAENQSDIRIDPTATHEGEEAWTRDKQGSNTSSTSSGQCNKQPKQKDTLSCETCSKFFSAKCHLEIHRRVHTGEKPFACSLCKKTFSEKGNLMIHMRVHSSEKLFSCNICKKSFKHKQSLLTHMRLHSGEKPFTCSVCRKAFRAQSSLIIHMSTHSGQRLFKCQECGKAFPRSSGLIKHKSSHSSERPFSCTDCGKHFIRSDHLSRHRRQKHNTSLR